MAQQYDSARYSFNRIPDTRLYIGGIQTLIEPDFRAAQMTHIVSVLPYLKANDERFKSYKHLHIAAYDADEANLLLHFPEAVQFISEALHESSTATTEQDVQGKLQSPAEAPQSTEHAIENSNKVYVHCHLGISRSATICCAYLMKTYNLDVDDALARIRKVRPFVQPNMGFMLQLSTWCLTGFTDNLTCHPIYQRWLDTHQQRADLTAHINRLKDQIGRDNIVFVHEDATTTTAEDQLTAATTTETPPPNQEIETTPPPNQDNEKTSPPNQENEPIPPPNQEDKATESAYRCRRCRRVLATSAFCVTDHASSTVQPHSPRSKNNTSANPAACAHVFVDPLAWMREELDKGLVEGRLDCPNAKCRAVVGRYAWQGCRCSCGRWVVPSIGLSKSKLDEDKNVPDTDTQALCGVTLGLEKDEPRIVETKAW